MTEKPKKTVKTKRKKKPGPKKKTFDLDKLKSLRGLGCTDDEIAAFFGVSTDTIGRRKKNNKKFAEAYKEGAELGKMSLRRLQWKKAKSGHAGMQIWLGKQHLGQKDRAASEISGPDGKPIETKNATATITADMDPKEAHALYAQMIKGDK